MTTFALAITLGACETKTDRDPPLTAEPPSPSAPHREPTESMEPPSPEVKPTPVLAEPEFRPRSTEPPAPDVSPEPPPPEPPANAANVVRVVARGSNWSVTLASPDTGCDQYANWWEVVRPDGTLVYRRILAHSHVDENPFTRSGGPVTVSRNDEVIIRAHMHPSGYGGRAFRGTLGDGFRADFTIDATFAPSLASAAPLPDGCAF